jgi:N-methylhydantoinase B/oxoprolinase/acetone carboxylase alpha subunit
MRSVEITANGNFSGGNNDTMNFIVRQYDDSDTLKATIDTQPQTLNGGASGTRAENINATGFADVVNGDYFEIWVENTGDSSNINTLENTKLTINER